MNKLTKTQIQEKISECLEPRKEVRFTYLFGSRVEGVSGPESDLDLAVYLDKEDISQTNPLYETRLSLEIEEAIGNILEVDILELNRASLILKYQVTSKGKLVFARNEEEARDFEALIRKKYFDFYPKRREYNEQRLKRYGVSE